MDYIELSRKKLRATVDANTRSGRFLIDLIDRGYNTPIDDWYGVKDYDSLPAYYDKEKFKMGQQFQFKYIAAVGHAKVLGLIAGILFAYPYLAFTQQSSTPRKAFKRYFATTVYVMRWYYSDLETDIEGWKSFNAVNRIHRHISRESTKHALIEFTQMHMSQAHMLFFILVITHPRRLGIDNATREEFEAFAHFWRVVGHLCGVKDEFNVCRDSFDETVEICAFMVKQITSLVLVDYDAKFYELATSTVGGFKYLWPTLHVDAILYQLWYDFNDENGVHPKLRLGWSARLSYLLIRIWIFLYRFTIVRYLVNAVAMAVLRFAFFIHDRQLI